MQLKIHTSTAPDLSNLESALVDADPSALVDFDAASGALRVSTLLQPQQVAALLRVAGLPVDEAQVTRVPSECCGGCGG
ncbi:MAG TPA: hypothetical protein VFE72_10630 [Lysobacter sp.]|nr:hypothetical protein [Lysobacter sp.]